MNATEQKTRHTTTQQLGARVEVLEILVERLSKNNDWLKAELDRFVALAAATNEQVDTFHNRLVAWSRLRWLFLGR